MSSLFVPATSLAHFITPKIFLKITGVLMQFSGKLAGQHLRTLQCT